MGGAQGQQDDGRGDMCECRAFGVNLRVRDEDAGAPALRVAPGSAAAPERDDCHLAARGRAPEVSDKQRLVGGGVDALTTSVETCSAEL